MPEITLQFHAYFIDPSCTSHTPDSHERTQHSSYSRLPRILYTSYCQNSPKPHPPKDTLPQ